jgi:hypothetical protein
MSNSNGKMQNLSHSDKGVSGYLDRSHTELLDIQAVIMNSFERTGFTKTKSWILLQKTSDKAFGVSVKLAIFWKPELLMYDPHVHFCVIINPERSLRKRVSVICHLC